MLHTLILDIKNSKGKYLLYGVVIPLLGTASLHPRLGSITSNPDSKAIEATGFIVLVYFATLFTGLMVGIDGKESRWRNHLNTLMCLPLSRTESALIRYLPAIVLPLLGLGVFLIAGLWLELDHFGSLLQMAMLGIVMGFPLLALIHLIDRIVGNKALLSMVITLGALLIFASFRPTTQGITLFLQQEHLLTALLVGMALLTVKAELWVFAKKG